MNSAAATGSRMPRANNFDIIRLFYAWMVVFYHAAILSGSATLRWTPHWCSGTVAVEGFFAISGCLITMSFDRNGKLKGYIARRAERILPAYYASTVFVLVLGVFLTGEPWQFLSAPGTLKYLGANLIFANHIHPSLPGLFVNNPSTAAVNGALWTIKVEILFYAFVPVFFWLCRKFGRVQVLALLFLGSLVYHAVLTRMGLPDYAKQLPGQLCFFMIGAAVYFYYPLFKKYRRLMWAAAAVSLILFLLSGVFAFRVVGVSLITMNAGLLLPVYLGPTRYGDFSYGAYVLHYPLVQAVVSLGVFAISPWLGMAACVICVLPLSLLSWNLVEKRFLQRQRVHTPKPEVVSAVS